MKETVQILAGLLLLVNVAGAQVHAGLSGKISVPLKFAYFIGLGGAGLHLEGGYLLKERVDFTASAENVWFPIPAQGLKTTAYQIGIKYIILKRSVKPYIGVGAGFFQTSYTNILSDGYTYKYREQPGVGCVPSVGVLVSSEWLKGLFINPEFSYYYTSPPQRIKPVNFSIGLVYFFECKKKADTNKE